MRVISGEKKGMRLFSTKDKNTRPTEDRIKEALFNILTDIDDNSMVLDLFAGTGSVGIEFLSRGAKFAVFSEKSKTNIKCIRDNLNHTNYTKKSKIYFGDYVDNLKNIAKDFTGFDYIFIDPPYDEAKMYYNSLNLIYRLKLLNFEGIIILESNIELDLKKYNIIKEKKYGKKLIYFIDLGVNYENNISR
ncbi:16S rRNA (guanine(966)-N(2))-methyltransferase RsmD [Miniphocaeibacter halophilus]|uniref:16S rRNA (Guanine(966)-N(2))-methyltransferase RsmD n=1 Tax=Miniphocaeibacter halophilus TaxID=2931922 RepID=A0AC61MQ44_9FIRM|nr:16S rRNA (guanine(966)-N(2))-methyltransferase RsmD [Miniphocaeibacter halophilus]QQK07747.1 16S rRNA (guanine(966)-N(2))-methyltransferase RsmD [Miniphocaeibacter halophilus]